jgi:hypothetical protein
MYVPATFLYRPRILLISTQPNVDDFAIATPTLTITDPGLFIWNSPITNPFVWLDPCPVSLLDCDLNPTSQAMFLGADRNPVSILRWSCLWSFCR